MIKRNPLHKKIGIIGGGQLGRMMIEESLRLNITFHVLDVPGCSCESLATRFIGGSLMDAAAIRSLAEISDVLTYEIEHVNVDELLKLESEGKEIIPSPKVLRIIQDKGLQKSFFKNHGLPVSDFALVETPEQWMTAIRKLDGDKCVAKTCRDGYDGKGVSIVKRMEVLENPSLIPFKGPSLVEAFVECEKELSVMVARDREGNTVTWPVVEMEFDPDANLVTFLDCPSSVSDEVSEKARKVAFDTINALEGVGVFAVELFLDKEGNILVNEVAPRPHNSGHHTIEACMTSQFEQLVRILLGLPLGSTELIRPAVMLNLLGASDFSGNYNLSGLEEASSIPGVFIHLYDKKTNKPMRKMGHVTIVGDSLKEAKDKALVVSALLKFTSYNSN